MPGTGPIRAETVEGPPIMVGEVTLIPEVQRFVLSQREGRLGRSGFGGHGWALVLLSPSAVIEQRDGRSRRLPIRDRTGQTLMAMTVLGLVVCVCCILVERFARSLSSPEWEGGANGTQPLV